MPVKSNLRKVKLKPRKMNSKANNEPMQVANAFSSEKTKINALFREKLLTTRQLAQLEDYANYLFADCLRKANNGEKEQMKRFLEAMAEKQRELIAEQQRKERLERENKSIERDKFVNKTNKGGVNRSVKKAKLDEGLLRLAKKGFVEPTKKGTVVAEGIALKLSREIQELEKNPFVNRDRLIKLKSARETLINYMLGRLERSHRLAEYMETLK